MKNRFVVTTMVVLASMMASEAVYAAPVTVHVPVHAMFSKVKTVSFNVRNDSKKPITLKVGETQMTLQPGKTAPMKLEVGQTVVAAETAGHYAAGAVIVTASSELSDATVALN